MGPNQSRYTENANKTQYSQYSNQDVQEARGSLQLLKKRLSSRENQTQQIESKTMNKPSQSVRQQPNSQNFNHVPKPPRAGNQSF